VTDYPLSWVKSQHLYDKFNHRHLSRSHDYRPVFVPLLNTLRSERKPDDQRFSRHVPSCSRLTSPLRLRIFSFHDVSLRAVRACV
jgi:hypothetical protein